MVQIFHKSVVSYDKANIIVVIKMKLISCNWANEGFPSPTLIGYYITLHKEIWWTERESPKVL